MKEARHRRASSFQCTKRLPAERGAQCANGFGITIVLTACPTTPLSLAMQFEVSTSKIAWQRRAD
jgi:hypothetical protein